MENERIEARKHSGLVIAALSRITFVDGAWIVPSQSTMRKYVVHPNAKDPRCTCPDFEETGVPCKHIYAARLVENRERKEDGSVTVIPANLTVADTVRKRKTYPQNWPAYNTAQTNEKPLFQTLLFDLCQAIEEPHQTRGRPRLPLSDAVFTATFKVYSGFSGRRFMPDLIAAHERGYITRVPHFNSIFNHLENEALTPILRRFIVETSRPLAAVETKFAADSSGFSVSRLTSWRERNHRVKAPVERDWVKAHIFCGVKTNIVTAVEIHERHTADMKVLPSLLETTGETFNIREVSADKAYLSYNNFRVIDEHGATPFIPFKSNSRKRGTSLWNRAFHYFHYEREDFLAHYHKRSNVEATFSMIKRKYGGSVLSRTKTAMHNEVYCKVLAHNISCLIHACYERGLTPSFLAIQDAA